jgi:hypothetical protein
MNGAPVPRWTLFGGAVYMGVAATGVPGLAAILRTLDDHNAARIAFIAEVLLAVAALGLGAVQTRAALTGGTTLRTIVRVLGFAVVVVFIGLAVTIGNATGTTSGGEIVGVGLVISLAAAAAQAALAFFNAFEIGVCVRLMPMGEHLVRQRLSGLLAWAAAAHIALKLASDGSVFFGAAGAVCAALLAGSVGARGRVALTSLIAVLGFGLQARSFAGTMQQGSVDSLPFCVTEESSTHENDVLAKRVRGLSGVADAAADVEGDRVTVYVLPLGGGAPDAVMKTSAEKAIAGVDCSIWDGKQSVRASRFEVQGTKQVPMDVTAKFHANKEAPADADKIIDAAVRERFDVTKKDVALVRVSGRRNFPDPSPTGLLGWVDYRVGEAALRDRVTMLGAGSVVTIGKVDVTVIPPGADPK